MLLDWPVFQQSLSPDDSEVSGADLAWTSPSLDDQLDAFLRAEDTASPTLPQQRVRAYGSDAVAESVLSRNIAETRQIPATGGADDDSANDQSNKGGAQDSWSDIQQYMAATLGGNRNYTCKVPLRSRSWG